jgi:NitT/TauT family transport system ATP-binding protein
MSVAAEQADAPASRRAASIALSRIVRRFETREGLFTAVDDVSFKIRSGEFVSLIGPSGCGKSTLMLIAAGLQPATSGEVAIDERRLDRPLTDVGIVFQDHLLLEFRTALANVMLQAEIRGLPRDPCSACSRSSVSRMRPTAIPSSSRAA